MSNSCIFKCSQMHFNHFCFCQGKYAPQFVQIMFFQYIVHITRASSRANKFVNYNRWTEAKSLIFNVYEKRHFGSFVTNDKFNVCFFFQTFVKYSYTMFYHPQSVFLYFLNFQIPDFFIIGSIVLQCFFRLDLGRLFQDAKSLIQIIQQTIFKEVNFEHSKIAFSFNNSDIELAWEVYLDPHLQML